MMNLSISRIRTMLRNMNFGLHRNRKMLKKKRKLDEKNEPLILAVYIFGPFHFAAVAAAVATCEEIACRIQAHTKSRYCSLGRMNMMLFSRSLKNDYSLCACIFCARTCYVDFLCVKNLFSVHRNV